MRYLLLIITTMFVFSSNVEAKKEWVDEAKLQAEALSKECHAKTVEPVWDSFFYNDEIKKGYKKYNACQKEIIIAKIKEKSTPENAEKMIKALDLMEQSMLEFYGVMYNQVNTGFYGQAVNDMELGRRFEEVLYDVLDYQSTYTNGRWDDLLP
ncbi:MAG: hypothetical protein KIC51_08545 [Acetobacter sp.]|nr:hypothetical protein [Acetobacter sp.]